MTATYHCPTCNKPIRHYHTHQSAHGLPGTHMSGSERFTCDVCGKQTFATANDASRFPFQLDKPTAITVNH